MLVVVMGSVGSFIAASEADTTSVRQVIVFVLRGALFALGIGFLASDWLEAKLGLAGHSALGGVAAVIGYRAHRLGDVVAWARLLQRKGAEDGK